MDILDFGYVSTNVLHNLDIVVSLYEQCIIYTLDLYCDYPDSLLWHNTCK